MFEKSLTDLVKGIRANKNNESAFITTCLAEIRQEVATSDIRKKAVAVQKLIYLHMLGYNMEWAAFNVVEVMTTQHFAFKRIGYLAAAQSFTPETEVNILATQTMRKDLKSLNQYEAGLAINALSTICSPELAKELVSEVVNLMNSQRPYIRKKASLVMYKIFLSYPDSLRPCFPKLKDKLADAHPSVISAAVNVVCELARKNPKNYLGMAPIFFKLMTTLNNNWTLIKIVKLFGALSPHEPRLAKKLVEPLANIINTTPAKSLLYECLNTVTTGMQAHLSVVKLAVEKLKLFVQDSDQNLKYLGLLGLNNLMPEHAKIISDLKDIILDCMDDEDVTIRYRAIDLLCGVVNKKNISAIMSRLFKTAQSAEGEFKNFLVEKIIQTCSKNTFENISDFKWYLKLLIDMTELKHVSHGNMIANQLMEILIRVPKMRAFGVTQMVKLLTASHIINESAETSSIFEVLYAASWLVGEFISESNESPKAVVEGMIQPRLASLPPRIQAAYVQAIIKLYAAVATSKKLEQKQDANMQVDSAIDAVLNDEPSAGSQTAIKGEKNKILNEMRNLIRRGFDEFLSVSDVEVQERVVICLKLMSIHEENLALGTDVGDQLSALFEDALNPVARGAQEQIKPPQGINLDEWIGEPFSMEVDSIADSWDKDEQEAAVSAGLEGGYQNESADNYMQGIGSHGGITNAVDEYQKNKDLFTLSNKRSGADLKNDPSVETKSLESLIGKQKKKVVKKKVRKPVIDEPVEIITTEEKPDFYVDPAEKTKKPAAASKQITLENFDPLGSIDLSKPIGADDKLYEPKAYPTMQEQAEIQKQKEDAARKEKQKKLQEKKAAAASKKDAPAAAAADEGTKKVVVKKVGGKTVKKVVKTKPAAASAAPAATSSPAKKDDSQILSDLMSAPAEKAAPAASKKKATIKKRRLAKDDNLGVSFNPYVMPTDASTIAVPIYLDSTASAQLSNVDFDLEATPSIKLVKEKSGPIRAVASLAPGQSNVLSIQLKFTGVEKALQTMGFVSYTDAQDNKHKIEFTLTLPSSMFITPKNISSEDLMNLAKNKQIANVASTKFALPAGKDGAIADITQASREIASLLRLALVEKTESAFQLYGVSVQNHHVAVLTKLNSPTQFTCEIKSSDDSLANSLLKEVHHVLAAHKK